MPGIVMSQSRLQRETSSQTSKQKYKRENKGPGKTSQQLRAMAAQPKDPGPILGTYMTGHAPVL